MKKFLLFISFCLLCLTQMSAATETWVKVTEEPTDWSGDYLIVYETGKKAFDGSLTKLDVTQNFKDVTILNNSITTTDCNFYFTIAAVSGGYSIKSKSGYYIGRTTTKNGLDSSTETQYANTISLSGGIKSSGGPKLQYYNSGNSSKFRYYASSQNAVALYKKQEGEVTQVAKPTTTATDKMLYGAEYTISTSTEGATLLYTTDGTENWITAEGANVPLNAPTEGESFTIKAYATKEGLTESEMLVKTVTLYSNNVASIADFLKAKDTAEAKTFTNPVTAIYQKGSNLWVKDDSGYLLVYGSLGQTYNEGDVIPGGFSGLYYLFNDLPELKNPANFAESKLNTGAVTPEEVTVELLAACDLNTYVSIKNVKYNGTSFSDDGTNSITCGTNNSGVTLKSGKTYDIKGFYSVNKTGYNITLISATEKQFVADLAITPAFGNIVIGETITISCATDRATIGLGEISGGAETIDISGSALPYSYTVKEEDLGKTLKVEAYASLEGYEDSPVLTGEYTVIAPTPKQAVFTNEADETVIGGDVNQGSYITCTWEDGCTAKITINDVEQTVEEGSTSFTWYADESYAAGAEVTIVVEVTNKYNVTSTAPATFTVVSPYKVVDTITVSDTGVTGTSYTSFSGKVKNGAEYAGRVAVKDKIFIQINGSTSGNAAGSGVFMTNSVGYVSKVSVEWGSGNSAGRKLNIYGKNEPYVAYASDALTDRKTYVGANNTARGTLLGTIVNGTSTELKIDGKYKYIFVQVGTENPAYLSSITFEWEDGYAGGKDVTYEKQTGTTHLTAGKFVTLVDTQNGKAVSRNGAVEGTIAGSAVAVENDAIALSKAQFSVDEFELVPADGGFKLYGGGSITRRYIAYDEATGLTTTENASEAAVVTFVSDNTGIIVKFEDGEILVSDGTNFGKGAVSTESPASLATGATLVPAYVFVSQGKDSTGVEDIETAETEAPAQYYNLNGVEVKADNLVPGIYIVRQGNKVSKHLIR